MTTPPFVGKYELVARIATGGMAEIYLARQVGAGAFRRLVVLKRILPHLAEERRFVDMFLEEARLASQIQHPNVVQIYDVDQHERSYYIAMEYIDGLSIGAICRRARKRRVIPPYVVAAEIVAQSCDGLHAAHELHDEAGKRVGLVHRDVSPHNLMSSKTGVVKLVDFGIAKAKNTAIRTRTGDVKGKYPYMSPEQVRAETLDRRTDIFSLGAIFAELLLGIRFFERSSELATLKAITEEPIMRVSDMNPRVPRPLSDLVARAMERRREDRYPDAAEMAAAVRDALEGLGERTSPQTVAEYLSSDCQELIDARSRAIRNLGQLPSFASSTIPRVAGFEESDHSGEPPLEEADQTKPLKVPTAISPKTEDIVDPSAKKSRRRPLVLAVVAVVLLTLAGGLYLFLRGPAPPSGPPLFYAHPPTYSPETVAKGFAPLKGYLERSLDRPVTIITTKNYATLRQSLIAGKVHLANLSPLLFVQTRSQEPKVRPLVSHLYEGARTYQSYLVTRTDTGIESPEDLEGRRFCFVDEGSTSGYLVPRHYLRTKGLDPEKAFSEVRLSGSHTKVMQDIVAGRCDAGAVYSGAFSSASDLGVASSRLRLVSVAGATPWDVVTASPLVEPEEAARIKRVFLDFEVQRDLGTRIMSEIFRIDGFVEPNLADFAPIEEAARVEGLLAH